MIGFKMEVFTVDIVVRCCTQKKCSSVFLMNYYLVPIVVKHPKQMRQKHERYIYVCSHYGPNNSKSIKITLMVQTQRTHHSSHSSSVNHVVNSGSI